MGCLGRLGGQDISKQHFWVGPKDCKACGVGNCPAHHLTFKLNWDPHSLGTQSKREGPPGILPKSRPWSKPLGSRPLAVLSLLCPRVPRI